MAADDEKEKTLYVFETAKKAEEVAKRTDKRTAYKGQSLMGRKYDKIFVMFKPDLRSEAPYKLWFTMYLPTKLPPGGKIIYLD